MHVAHVLWMVKKVAREYEPFFVSRGSEESTVRCTARFEHPVICSECETPVEAIAALDKTKCNGRAASGAARVL